MVLYGRDRFVTVLEKETLRNKEVASELGAALYCLEKISDDKYVVGGDENEARII